MQADAIELVVVTPGKQLLRQSVTEVQIPGAAGYLGILPGHAPLMTELGIGELTYQPKFPSEPVRLPPSSVAPVYKPEYKKEPPHLTIISGFAEVLPGRVTVLAETAEFAAEIDLARAEAAKARAEKHLASGDPNIDWDRASIALQRALIRIQVARKYGSARMESP